MSIYDITYGEEGGECEGVRRGVRWQCEGGREDNILGVIR